VSSPIRVGIACALVLACSLVSTGATKKPTIGSKARHAAQAHSGKGKKSRKASWRRGQQKIDPKRARDIQEALIREHYLEGTPSGVWNDASQKAMERYQADNGWQTKVIPDSRALIKLGLGPDHQHLLNPESAMTTAPRTDTTPVSSAVQPQR
jgi:hypothetical protein